MNGPRKRVVLVDDHPIVMAGIAALIADSPDFEVAGVAASGSAGLDVIANAKPDLAVVDLSMPGMNGVELVCRIAEAHPATMVLVLTVHEEPAYVQQVMKARARGYLLKRSAAEELPRALRAVMAHGLYIDPAVAAKLLGPLNRSPTSSAATLSAREEDVMKAAALGLSSKEIASHLVLSVKTIETYKARGMEKLNFRTRADLVRYATIQGWMRA